MLMMLSCAAVIQGLFYGPDSREFCYALADKELLEARPPLSRNIRRIHVEGMETHAKRHIALDVSFCASSRKVCSGIFLTHPWIARTGDAQL